MLNITRPTLLLDESKCKRNIQEMVLKSERLGVKLVPHFKTHQSDVIGGWFKNLGIEAITVSSVKMAEYFAANGWRNITIAFPINVLEVDVLNQMISSSVDLTLLIVSTESIMVLDKKLKGHVKVLIELDAGYNRTGVPTEDVEAIRQIAEATTKSNHLDLYGLYCHPGNTYHAESVEQIKGLWADAIAKVVQVKSQLSLEYPALTLRMGDTPGCTVVESTEGIDEIGPGNFVFYDLVMNHLDVCSEEQIAVAMACPVVAKNEARNEVVIHGGAVHFSKDHLFDEKEQKFFGEVVIITDNGWSPIIDGIKLTSVSQEHGILSANSEVFNQIEVGDVLGVLPIHSCLTANLMKSYTTLEGKVIDHLEKVF